VPGDSNSNSSSGHHVSSSSSSSGRVGVSAPATLTIPEGRLIETYATHGYEVLTLAVAADNARFASAGGDRAVFLWAVATAQTLRRFGGGATGTGGHGGRINAVAFAGQGDSVVVSGGLDTTVRLWDAKSNALKPVQVLAEARDAVSALAVTGATVVAGSVDGRVRSYDVRMGRCVTDVFAAPVTSLCLARDGKTILVGTLDSKVRLMDRENGACLRTYGDEGWRNEELRVQSVLGGKERFVVTGDEMTATAPAGETANPTTGPGTGNEGRVWVWDLLTGKLVTRLVVPWGSGGSDSRRKVVGRDGKEKERKNVMSCLAWRNGGYGDQFCVGGTSGVVTVFGSTG
jgi:mitogen-activated protein kinase organizer 1